MAGSSQTLPPAELLEKQIEAIQYEQVLMAEGPEGADRWENVRELVARAAESFAVHSHPQDEIFALTFADVVRGALAVGRAVGRRAT